MQLTQTQRRVIDALQKAGGRCWAVGGAVRDLQMGKQSKDVDLATDLLPSQIRLTFLEANIHCIPDKVAYEHGILRVIGEPGEELTDIASLRRDVSGDGRHAQIEFTTDIVEDLARRDLTINAMAMDISTGEVIDPFGGIKDIKNTSLCFVGDPRKRIQEDYLRMVRLCRFAALGPTWTIKMEDFEALAEFAGKIHTISKERIRDEVVKALGYQKPSSFFKLAASTGLLKEIFPDLDRGREVFQNKYHGDDVFTHLCKCLDASVEFTDNPMLRLAALTHDIAKPHTKAGEGENCTFYKHEVVGADIMYKWMNEYRFPKKDVLYVTKLVRHHQWRFEEDTTDKAIRKWLQEVGKETWKDLITLRMADRKGNIKRAHKPAMTEAMKDLVARVERILSETPALFKEDLLINGDDLLALGIKPGPVYKEIFSNILGLVITDQSKNNREWLLNFVKKNYVKENKND